MAGTITGWRLPLKLAARDLRRYKGRSLLASLLIIVPVLAMATMLTFMRTYDVDPDEQRAQDLRSAAASVSWQGWQQPTQDFPAAGRRLSGDSPRQPSAAQVSQQAHAPAVEENDVLVRLSPSTGGPSFAPTDRVTFRQTDLASAAVRPTVTLDSGRLPTRPGEVVVTRTGRNDGIPGHGTVVARAPGGSSRTDAKTLTVVGTVTASVATDLMGPAVPQLGSSADGAPTFIISGPEWSWKTIEQWRAYGATVETRSHDAYADESTHTDPVTSDGLVITAMATMGFIAVTALLAGPAFAASATRQRRTLGLIASNGATRGVLRRVVLAQALLLGAVAALVSAVTGGVAGTVVARWLHLRREGTPASLDVPVSWLVGVVVVATVASLVAAFVPARSAGRTNLLAALRGQVSSRRVKRRWPLLGVVGVAIGTLCLFVGTIPHAADNDKTMALLMIYIGVPMFFGGAVLAVPFVLALTGRLARFLPVAPRIAVRDVSRQRTRATASVGAVLATVSVLCALLIFGASLDAHDEQIYRPVSTVGSGVVASDPGVRISSTEASTSIATVRSFVRESTPLWTSENSEVNARFTDGQCTPGSTAIDPAAGTTVLAIDRADVDRAGFGDAARASLTKGGAVVLPSDPRDVHAAGTWLPTEPTPPTVKNGRITLRDQNLTADGPRQRGCTPWTLDAVTVPHAPPHLASLPPGTVVVTRDTFARTKIPMTLAGISLDPSHPISDKRARELSAALPSGMIVRIEHGYHSPIGWILTGLTAGFALIVLLTTIVSTLLNDAEAHADMATLAATGASRGMRRRIVGAHAAAIGFIGALVGVVIGFVPGLVLARVSTTRDQFDMRSTSATYTVPWWHLAAMIIVVPLVAALISMIFARRTPSLTRREI